MQKAYEPVCCKNVKSTGEHCSPLHTNNVNMQKHMSIVTILFIPFSLNNEDTRAYKYKCGYPLNAKNAFFIKQDS